MSLLPEESGRRLGKVLVRTLHLIGTAGVFGSAMMQSPAPVYFTLAIVSGVILVVLDSWSGWIWFVQLRGFACYLKLLLLLLMHRHPAAAIPYLIAIIVLSGFVSHAPSWIRYFSLLHGKVVHSADDLLG